MLGRYLHDLEIKTKRKETQNDVAMWKPVLNNKNYVFKYNNLKLKLHVLKRISQTIEYHYCNKQRIPSFISFIHFYVICLTSPNRREDYGVLDSHNQS